MPVLSLMGIVQEDMKDGNESFTGQDASRLILAAGLILIGIGGFSLGNGIADMINLQQKGETCVHAKVLVK